MTVAEFAKLFTNRPQNNEVEDFEHDHSLRAIARQHAAHTATMRAGTAFDWEDMPRYQEELERLDRDGLGPAGQHCAT